MLTIVNQETEVAHLVGELTEEELEDKLVEDEMYFLFVYCGREVTGVIHSGWPDNKKRCRSCARYEGIFDDHSD